MFQYQPTCFMARYENYYLSLILILGRLSVLGRERRSACYKNCHHFWYWFLKILIAETVELRSEENPLKKTVIKSKKNIKKDFISIILLRDIVAGSALTGSYMKQLTRNFCNFRKENWKKCLLFQRSPFQFSLFIRI